MGGFVGVGEGIPTGSHAHRTHTELRSALMVVLWCFVLNPNRRSRYPTLLWCDTRYATDEFLGQRNRPSESSRLDRDGLDERGHFRTRTRGVCAARTHDLRCGD